FAQGKRVRVVNRGLVVLAAGPEVVGRNRPLDPAVVARPREVDVVEFVIGESQEDFAAIEVQIGHRWSDAHLCGPRRTPVSEPAFAPGTELSACANLQLAQRKPFAG